MPKGFVFYSSTKDTKCMALHAEHMGLTPSTSMTRRKEGWSELEFLDLSSNNLVLSWPWTGHLTFWSIVFSSGKWRWVYVMFNSLELHDQLVINKILTNSLPLLSLGFPICKMQVRTPSSQVCWLIHSFTYSFIQKLLRTSSVPNTILSVFTGDTAVNKTKSCLYKVCIWVDKEHHKQ